MRPLTEPRRAILRALVECADGAATISWLMAYCELSHAVVERGIYQLARMGYAHWVGTSPRTKGRDGRRPNVYAATPRGRALVVSWDAAPMEAAA